MSKAHKLKVRNPNSPVSSSVPINFLLGCSEIALANFELARQAEAADLRKEMHVGARSPEHFDFADHTFITEGRASVVSLYAHVNQEDVNPLAVSVPHSGSSLASDTISASSIAVFDSS